MQNRDPAADGLIAQSMQDSDIAQLSNLSEVDGATGIACVFGDPVEHSKSPPMHNAAYGALGINRKYIACNVRRENLAAALHAIPALGIIGVNLTVPHKEIAARLIKDLSDEAKMLAAVNCVINRRGKLYGDNTDARGLERDLRDIGTALKGGLAIVIGAGGAAASAVVACARIGASRVIVSNRTHARASRLAARLKKARGIRAKIEPRGLDALLDEALLAEARIVINATPMGLTTRRFAKLDYAATRGDCLFYDLIYSSSATAFLKPAIAAGRPTADGAGMLVNQGELAFRLFNRVSPPPGVMRAALWKQLGRT